MYNRFHDPDEDAADIARLRELHVEMDRAVARAYGWDDLDLGHGFHETRQGVRFTISEAARQEVLDRLLALNHERYAEEVEEGLHEKGAKKKARRQRKLEPAPAGRRAAQPDLGFEFQLTPPASGSPMIELIGPEHGDERRAAEWLRDGLLQLWPDVAGEQGR